MRYSELSLWPQIDHERLGKELNKELLIKAESDIVKLQNHLSELATYLTTGFFYKEHHDCQNNSGDFPDEVRFNNVHPDYLYMPSIYIYSTSLQEPQTRRIVVKITEQMSTQLLSQLYLPWIMRYYMDGNADIKLKE